LSDNTNESNTSKEKKEWIELPIPDLLKDLIISVSLRFNKLLKIEFVEKYNKPLIFAINADKIAKSMELFEDKVKRTIPTISNKEYNELEELILSNIGNLDNQKSERYEKRKKSR